MSTYIKSMCLEKPKWIVIWDKESTCMLLVALRIGTCNILCFGADYHEKMASDDS
jgi:hypothetical protein